ncbi:MAG: hypothetical protein V3U58_01090 [Thermodesulfobacteriota bacterium]
MTLIQPQHKGGAFKGPAKGQCLNCIEEQEYDLTAPANKGDLINIIETVTPKADVHLTASIGSNRPKADIRLWKPSRTMRIFTSEEYFLWVLRRISLTTDLLDTFC